MFKICVLFSVTFLISICLMEVLSDDKNYCKKWGIQIEEGKTATVPGECYQATCVKASTNEISGLECPVYKLRAGCHVTEEDLTKPYPECCPQPVCPEE